MKNRIGPVGRVAFAMGVTCVALWALDATVSTAEARGGGVVCPAVYAPVICDNGRIYSNSCWASVAGATGCVPLWPPIIISL